MNITHDFHVHTERSLCANGTATLENYLAVAKELGLNKIGFSDHYWDENVECIGPWYEVMNSKHISFLKEKIDAMGRECDGVSVYFGCEAEYDLKNKSFAVSEKTAEMFDFIIVPNSHTHLTMPDELYYPYEKHKDFMIQAYNEILESPMSRYLTAIAHPFEAVACPYGEYTVAGMMTDDEFCRLFDKTAEKGIGVEINVCWMREKKATEEMLEPQLRMLSLAKKCGCKFIFGSDAHGMGEHEGYIENCAFFADRLSLKYEDMLEITK